VWVISKKKNIWGKNKKIIFFYTIWVVPGFLYNLFLGSQHAGYQMSYLTCFLILISYAVWQTTKKYKMLFVFTVCAIALFNLYWFFFDRDPHFVKPYRPTSFHYSDIRKNDVKVGSKVQFVQERFDPQKTLLISTEVLWRPYSYYLKTYHLIALTALDNIESPYIYNRFETTNWNLRWYQTKNFTVIIPKNILAVIFMDDPASQWIRNYRFIQYNLPGNSSITKMSVKPGDTIVYGYHSIKVINHYE